MYKFYQDKSENFECNINVEGSNISKAKARLVLENNEFNLVFNGTIDSSGKCIIAIPKLKILSENLKGNLTLEVIVDNDTYFQPYKDEFEVGINKKVTVEVINNNQSLVEAKSKVTATISNTDLVVNEIFTKLIQNKISIYNLSQVDKRKMQNIFLETMNKHKIKDKNIILEKLLLKLK